MATQKNVKKQNKVADFFKGVKGEIKKVSWPSRKELINYTLIVVLACALMTIVIWGLDLLFHGLFGRLV